MVIRIKSRIQNVVNKAHAACYAMTSYITGYLKYHFPAEYNAAVLNSADFEKVPGLVSDMNDVNVKCLRPDVNRSELAHSVDKATGNVRFGLSGIKGLGKSAAVVIEERRENGEYRSVADFVIRVLPSKTILEGFCDAGAFDALCDNRSAIRLAIPALLSGIKNLKDVRKKIAANSMLASETMRKKHDEYTAKEVEIIRSIREIELTPVSEDLRANLEKERELTGSYLSAHPLDLYPEASELSDEIIPIADISEPGNDVAVYGIIGNFIQRFTKKDKSAMATFTVTDRTKSIECVCFPKQYARLKGILKDGAVLIFGGKAEKDDRSGIKIFVDDAQPVQVKKHPVTIHMQSMFDYMDAEKVFRRFVAKNGDPLKFVEIMAPEKGIRDTGILVDRAAFTKYCRENGIIVD